MPFKDEDVKSKVSTNNKRKERNRKKTSYPSDAQALPVEWIPQPELETVEGLTRLLAQQLYILQVSRELEKIVKARAIGFLAEKQKGLIESRDLWEEIAALQQQINELTGGSGHNG